MSAFSLIQIVNIVLAVLWPVLSLLALIQVRQKRLAGWYQIAWTLIILIIPILGAMAFFVVAPERQEE